MTASSLGQGSLPRAQDADCQTASSLSRDLAEMSRVLHVSRFLGFGNFLASRFSRIWPSRVLLSRVLHVSRFGSLPRASKPDCLGSPEYREPIAFRM